LPLEFSDDLRRHLGHIATTDGDHQVSGPSDPGHGRCCLVPYLLVGHFRRSRCHGVGHHPAVDAGDRVLTIAAHIHHDRLVGAFQRARQLTPEVSGAGIQMRLEAHHDPAIACARTSRRQSVGDLGRMVRVVVVDPNAVDCAHQLETPISAAIAGQLNANLLVRNSQPRADGIAGRGIADVVVAGHRQRDRSASFGRVQLEAGAGAREEGTGEPNVGGLALAEGDDLDREMGVRHLFSDPVRQRDRAGIIGTDDEQSHCLAGGEAEKAIRILLRGTPVDQVVRIHVGDNGDLRRILQERAVALVRLYHQHVSATDMTS
jgi:hypothetical protein